MYQFDKNKPRKHVRIPQLIRKGETTSAIYNPHQKTCARSTPNLIP